VDVSVSFRAARVGPFGRALRGTGAHCFGAGAGELSPSSLLKPATREPHQTPKPDGVLSAECWSAECVSCPAIDWRYCRIGDGAQAQSWSPGSAHLGHRDAGAVAQQEARPRSRNTAGRAAWWAARSVGFHQAGLVARSSRGSFARCPRRGRGAPPGGQEVALGAQVGLAFASTSSSFAQEASRPATCRMPPSTRAQLVNEPRAPVGGGGAPGGQPGGHQGQPGVDQRAAVGIYPSAGSCGSASGGAGRGDR